MGNADEFEGFFATGVLPDFAVALDGVGLGLGLAFELGFGAAVGLALVVDPACGCFGLLPPGGVVGLGEGEGFAREVCELFEATTGFAAEEEEESGF
jgi:hypothetical protein